MTTASVTRSPATIWSAELSDAPKVGEVVTLRRRRDRNRRIVQWTVVHVGRLVWLHAKGRNGYRLESGWAFWERFDRKQLSLFVEAPKVLPAPVPAKTEAPAPLVFTGAKSLPIGWLALCALALFALASSGCFTLASIGVSPNGSLWLGGNIAYDGPAVYACPFRDGALRCTRIDIHGIVGTPP